MCTKEEHIHVKEEKQGEKINKKEDKIGFGLKILIMVIEKNTQQTIM